MVAYKIRGKEQTDIDSLILDPKAIESLGAFALVVEGGQRGGWKIN